MQNVDLKKIKAINSFWSKTKVGQLEKKLFLIFFSIEIFLNFIFKFLKIVCFDQIQKSHTFYKEKLQSLNQASKKNNLINVVQLWNFFL